MTTIARLRLEVGGAVQGVGFRPTVWRLAHDLGLGGFVRNGPGGVEIEVEGEAARLAEFENRLLRLSAPIRVESIGREARDPVDEVEFVIRESRLEGPAALALLPDLVVCEACLRELLDPNDRRFRYPFISCAVCGPRYSIVESLPWDRARSSMRAFPMCPRCRSEYHDPADRRFHAETIACPDCGPRLEAVDPSGRELAGPEAALELAAATLEAGGILALKGLGGYQLLCDATSEQVVRRLRERKHRPDKPLALMVRDLEAAARLARIDGAATATLGDRAGAIVLLRRRPDAAIAPAVAPELAQLGLMLPTTPLHHLLARTLDRPLVATSGNIAGDPILAADDEALAGLAGVADLFLRHDREIRNPIDDSVVRVIAGEPSTIRCARGLAPLRLPFAGDASGLAALGGDLKAAVALGRAGEIVLGPHVGDLETLRSQEAAARSIATLGRLAGAPLARVVADSHPDWFAGRLARRLADEVLELGHHEAHALAALVDHEAVGDPCLAVAWDGAGHGGDGSVWGGEFLALGAGPARRVGHLLPFRLPGGDQAQREPRRALLALLAVVDGAAVEQATELRTLFRREELRVLTRMIAGGRLAPVTTSAGRLFDGIAALLGLGARSSYEGQAAMALESRALLAREREPGDRSPLVQELGCRLDGDRLDWRPLLVGLRRARAAGDDPERLAAWAHEALARGIRDAVLAFADPACRRVVLTGGCFQNALLAERATLLLKDQGYRVLRHRRVPANDGGIAVGQIAAFAAGGRN
ncbi:MAG: carbamoyltransferase HypF [Planctomycetes bacterium]|nr:carbamoyltransferase HypF [Planctomycetota bacterium]